MAKATDIRVIGATLYFLPVQTRVQLKFGPETLTEVTCARACVKVADEKGQVAQGWGETPLSVQWVWPSATAYEERRRALKDFCVELTESWAGNSARGHPMEMGQDFLEGILPGCLAEFNGRRAAVTEHPTRGSQA